MLLLQVTTNCDATWTLTWTFARPAPPRIPGRWDTQPIEFATSTLRGGPLQWLSVIVVVIVVLLALGLWAAYNGLVKKRNRTQEAWSEIDVELKRRHDLIPNLVSTVQGYAAHEQGTFEAVTQARANAVTAGATGDPAKIAPAENALSGALRSLFAVAENYPQLRAVESFLQLQETLTATEDKIEYARRYYNTSARDYNIALQTFPRNLIAGPFGFKAVAFFGADEEDRAGAPGQLPRLRAGRRRPGPLGTAACHRLRGPPPAAGTAGPSASQLRPTRSGTGPAQTDWPEAIFSSCGDALLDGRVGVVEAVVPGLVVLQRVVDAHRRGGVVHLLERLVVLLQLLQGARAAPPGCGSAPRRSRRPATRGGARGPGG